MIALLIIGSIAALVCAVILYGMLTGPVLGNPVTNADIVILGLYLTVTVICVAGAGIISAVRELRSLLEKRIPEAPKAIGDASPKAAEADPAHPWGIKANR
jgi:hypothetical protein